MVRGNASVSSGTDVLDPLKRGNLLASSDTVQSRSGSELDVALLPGFLLRASGDSKFTIQELRLTKDGNETQGGMVNRRVSIRLEHGTATLSLQLPNEEPGQFIVRTDHVTIKADIDALVQIDAAPDTTRIVCVRGTVVITGTNGQTSVLNSGSFQRWGSGATEPLSAQDDLNIRAESDKAVRTETALLQIDPPETFHVR